MAGGVVMLVMVMVLVVTIEGGHNFLVLVASNGGAEAPFHLSAISGDEGWKCGETEARNRFRGAH